ncbi:hypothetical protein QPK87_04870 [Kamptonema cortianum]|nr:hypothetical protein [Geitlerinema splendidum]MDK3155909.1 hypothetical protein [Kamptonema cortianum]
MAEKIGGAVHGFRNISHSTSSFLGISTPGGHEAFFEDAGQLSPKASMDEVKAVFEKHGIQIVAAPVS